MKKILATLLLLPSVTLTSMSFAAEATEQKPVLMSEAQMDSVTAGSGHRHEARWDPCVASYQPRSRHQNRYRNNDDISALYKQIAELTQINNSPVTIIQIGNNNTAIVYSGNFARIFQ